MNPPIYSDLIISSFKEEPGLTASGLFYGFPECCISSFAKFEQLEVFEKFPDLPSIGTGFVPCIKCAPKVKLNWLAFKKENIIKNRHCKEEFPAMEVKRSDYHLFFIKLSCELGIDPFEASKSFKDGKEIRKILRQSKPKKKSKIKISA